MRTRPLRPPIIFSGADKAAMQTLRERFERGVFSWESHRLNYHMRRLVALGLAEERVLPDGHANYIARTNKMTDFLNAADPRAAPGWLDE